LSHTKGPIIDTLSHAGRYHALGDRIAAGLRFLVDNDLQALEPGRHDILGDDCYALVEDYQTAPRDGRRWEAHRNHIDIQCVASGRELLGCADLAQMQSAEYDPAKDLEFVSGPDGQFTVVEAGTFVILRPTDAHMPGIAVDRPEPVRKVVVKVLL
jgi:YhcH/YjgK/YiaL family protein